MVCAQDQSRRCVRARCLIFEEGKSRQVRITRNIQAMNYPVAVPWNLVLTATAAMAVLLAVAAVVKVPVVYNTRNLALRWRTTLITVAAFALVVSILTIMLAFVNGMSALANASSHPENVIVLSQGVMDELLSWLPVADVGDIGLQDSVSRDDKGRPLCSREIYTVISQPGGTGAGESPEHHLLQLRGIEDVELAAQVHDVKLYPDGRWFSETGVRAERGQGSSRAQALTEASSQSNDTEPVSAQPVIEAVLGEGLARELRLAVGDTFMVGPWRCQVVGIMRSAGSMFSSEIWAKSQSVGQISGIEYAYTTIVLRTADAASARELAGELSRRYKKAAWWALPEIDYQARLAEMNRKYLAAVSFITSFMAVGGALGLMNTMFAAVNQRTKDFAVLRVLGYRRWHIVTSLLFESLLIAAAGGLAGCALGLVANGLSAAATVSGEQSGGKDVMLRLIVDRSTIGLGLLFTVVMGLAGGVLPALSATRLKPLESLRA
jgi:hypothetical protein